MRFQAKPFHVEAHRFTGLLNDLPVEFQAVMAQSFLGERAYLPSSVNHTTPDGEPIYAAADIVEPGFWIVKVGERYWSMSPGQFEAWFENTEPTISPSHGRWQAVWHGGEPGEPQVLNWLGHSWRVGVPIGLNDPAHVALVTGNAQFTVEDTHGSHGGAVGRASLAQAGHSDDPAIGDHGGYDDLHGDGYRDPGAAGAGNYRADGELAIAVVRRGPGRPRKQDAALSGLVADSGV